MEFSRTGKIVPAGIDSCAVRQFASRTTITTNMVFITLPEPDYCGRAGSGGGAGVFSSAAPLIEGSSVIPLLFSRFVFTSTF